VDSASGGRLCPCVVRVLQAAVSLSTQSSHSLAAHLHLSHHTVDDHFRTAIHAFGVETRGEAVVYALTHGIISSSAADGESDAASRGGGTSRLAAPIHAA